LACDQVVARSLFRRDLRDISKVPGGSKLKFTRIGFRPADTVVTTAVVSRRIGRQSNIGHFGTGDLEITLSKPPQISNARCL